MEAGGWQPIETAPKDGTRFLAAEWDGQGWIIGPCLWCKTPHVPLYGFHFTEGDPENWEIANPQFHQPLLAPPSSPAGEANEYVAGDAPDHFCNGVATVLERLVVANEGLEVLASRPFQRLPPRLSLPRPWISTEG